MNLKKAGLLTLIICSSVLLYINLTAYSTGIYGATRKYGWQRGCECHSFTATKSVSVIISGPAAMRAGDTATYKLSLFGGPLVAGGCNIAVEHGILAPSYLDTNLQEKVNELTHISPKYSVGGDTISWTFKYKAPRIIPPHGDTIYANGNSVNRNGFFSGEAWNWAANFTINILPPTSIIKNSETANGFELSQNYPNPFNPSTKINFAISKSSFVSLKVYDNLGRLAADLVNRNLSSGSYEVTLDASHYLLTSGIYYYALEANGFNETRKMILYK